jgi:hypothetical protein
MVSSRSSVKVFGILVFLAHLPFQSTPAEAISLEFLPTTQSVMFGNQVTVDVNVSNPNGTLVGAYDFFVNYNPDVLTLNDVVFGSALGGPPDSIQDDIESPAGQINVSELSLLTDLTALQNGIDDLLLFSIIFDTDTLGSSPLTFSENIAGVAGGFLGDETGQAILLDSVGSGSINVVPIPGAIWLMISGLFALYGFTRRQGMPVG